MLHDRYKDIKVEGFIEFLSELAMIQRISAKQKNRAVMFYHVNT